MADETYRPDDGIQHGIDDNPENDAQKGAAIGGVGGAAVGAAAGAMAGPLGAVAGALVGGAVGAVASGAAVAAIDAHDNDNNVTGLGDDVAYKNEHDDDVDEDDEDLTTDAYTDRDTVAAGTYTDRSIATGAGYDSGATAGTLAGAGTGAMNVPTTGTDYATNPDYGSRGGSYGTDTRGPGERIADAVTGDDIDDKTGRRV